MGIWPIFLTFDVGRMTTAFVSSGRWYVWRLVVNFVDAGGYGGRLMIAIMSLALLTYVADTSHDVFLLVRHSSWEPLFYVDICYISKRRYFFSILDRCRNIGYVTTFLKIYATKVHLTQKKADSNHGHAIEGT